VIVITIVVPGGSGPFPSKALSSYVHVTVAVAQVSSYRGDPLPFAPSARAETSVAVTPAGSTSTTVTFSFSTVWTAPSLRTINLYASAASPALKCEGSDCERMLQWGTAGADMARAAVVKPSESISGTRHESLVTATEAERTRPVTGRIIRFTLPRRCVCESVRDLSSLASAYIAAWQMSCRLRVFCDF
jgi:hypothetical protein